MSVGHKGDSRSMLVWIGIVVILTGCSGRKVASSAGDQNLVSSQETSSQAGAGAMPREELRVTEPAIAPPLVASKPAIQPSPGGLSDQPGDSAVPTAPLAKDNSLSDVFFDYDRFTLRTDARATLEADARVLKASDSRQVLIEGHCDERGTLAYNLVLGERRAQSVKRYLQELGIPASHIHITSYGKERPFCREHRDACWQQNRRAHFAMQ